jgi:DNA invertase Pin-like site-specific DNA recombinase
MLKTVIYFRVSTQYQNADNQTNILLEWAKVRGLEIVGVYSETKTAWKTGHQAELAQLKADAVKRKFDILLVWALDSLSREGSLSILQLISTL